MRRDVGSTSARRWFRRAPSMLHSIAIRVSLTGNQDTAIARYIDTLLGGTCATLFNCVTVTGLDSSGNPSGYVVADQTI